MDIKGGLAHVLDQIEREKGIKKEEILRMIEHALESAYRKHAGEGLNVVAKVDPSGEISSYMVKTIVKEVTNDQTEISLAEAKGIDPSAQEGGEVRYPIDTEEFGRIAAQTAKQVLTQKIRETERETVYEEFKPKEGTLVNGTVHRFANRNIIVELGRAEGVLPMREQVRRERWTVGERIRVLIMRAEKGPRGPEILLSRANELFVQRLFEQEVPEIYEKTIQVVKVVREPGQRSKVVVQSFNPKVDPIGACVGVKGSRVRPIINELQGERIDLVAYSEDAATYIAAALAPAKPLSVTILDPDRKLAEALVTDDSLSLAIGKNGQNVRLASKLTGWEIDIKTESQRSKESAETASAAKDILVKLEGLGPRTAEILIKGGMDKVEKIAKCKPEDLTVFSGIGEKVAEKMIESAIDYLKKKEAGELTEPDAPQEAPSEVEQPETSESVTSEADKSESDESQKEEEKESAQ